MSRLAESLNGAGLTRHEEEALTLLHEHGLDQQEIGARMGIQADTVQDHIQRGHRKMRAFFIKHRRHEQRFADLKAALAERKEQESEAA